MTESGSSDPSCAEVARGLICHRRTPDGTVLVAVDEAAAIGVITISEQRPFTGEADGYIGELAVASHAARQGIGRALIAAAEVWARDHELRHLTLHTGTANFTARRFYDALGFQEEEIRLTRPV